jgi:hypothetical protein
MKKGRRGFYPLSSFLTTYTRVSLDLLGFPLVGRGDYILSRLFLPHRRKREDRIPSIPLWFSRPSAATIQAQWQLEKGRSKEAESHDMETLQSIEMILVNDL